MDKEIEIQRESLYSHEQFDPNELFGLIDTNNDGLIDANDLDVL